MLSFLRGPLCGLRHGSRSRAMMEIAGLNPKPKTQNQAKVAGFAEP